MSELFLDTELDELSYQYIARSIAESDYSSEEVEAILWNEVYPILSCNLNSVAGVWDGWSDTWLLQHLQVCDQPKSLCSKSGVRKEIKLAWSLVLKQVANHSN